MTLVKTVATICGYSTLEFKRMALPSTHVFTTFFIEQARAKLLNETVATSASFSRLAQLPTRVGARVIGGPCDHSSVRSTGRAGGPMCSRHDGAGHLP